jgi:hypothetical protein
VPDTNWQNLPQRIVEGIAVGLVVATLLGLARLMITWKRQ